MKYHKILFFVTLASLLIISCKTIDESSKLTTYKDGNTINDGSKIEITLLNGKSFNHPTYVIWQEDMEGNYIKTLFVTKSYASGIFENKMIDDSIWFKEEGSSPQPAALPYWTYKKGLIAGQYLLPSPEHPFVDAYSGATPQNDFKFITSSQNNKTQYKILLEVNQAWDWNKYWTNVKFENNNSYNHSAQPSLIYSVTINHEDTIYYLNAIGHGDPKGESGKLFTNLSTLTTPKEIFKTLQITIKD